MTRPGRWSVAVGVAGAGAALGVTFTRPFTVGADVVTAVPLVVVFVLTLITIISRRTGDGVVVPAPDGVPAPSRRWLWWWAPLLAATGWELYCYVSLPRVDHPTLSVLIDMLDGTGVGKFVAFASWLALGWFLVRT